MKLIIANKSMLASILYYFGMKSLGEKGKQIHHKHFLYLFHNCSNTHHANCIEPHLELFAIN